jgi:hypothetical protein
VHCPALHLRGSVQVTDLGSYVAAHVNGKCNVAVCRSVKTGHELAMHFSILAPAARGPAAARRAAK